MTSQKSSVNSFSRSFWHTVRSYPYLPVLGLIGLLCGVAFVCGDIFSGSYPMYVSDAADAVKYKITDMAKFSILGFSSSDVDVNFALHISLAGVAIILAVQIFRFMCTKKSSNVWFSLGITRTKLFVSKYLAGFFMLAVMLIVPFLIVLLANISVFGISRELVFSWIYLLIGYIVYTINIFTLASAVMCLAGTVAEGIIFSAGFLLTPELVYYEITKIMNRLTFGSEFCVLNGSLTQKTKTINPIYFLYDRASSYSSLTRGDIRESFSWSMPNFTGIIIFSAAIIAVFALSIVLINRRKTEIAGFWGASKLLRFLGTLDAVMLVFSLTVSYTSLSSFAAILVGLLTGAAAYLAVDFLFTFNFRVWVKHIRFVPVHLGIAALAGIIFATGLFGYSSRIPSPEKVESVSITPTTYTGVIYPNSFSSYIDSYRSLICGYAQSGDGVTLTSKADISLVSDIHKQFIDWGVVILDHDTEETDRTKQYISGNYTLVYTLSNGSTVTRSYNYAPISIISTFIKLEDTDYYREQYKLLMTEPKSAIDNFDTASRKDLYQNNDNAVYIASKFFDQSYSMLTLTETQRTELLNAVAKDLVTLSATEKLKPQAEQRAVLVFTRDSIKGIRETAEKYGSYSGLDAHRDYPTNSCAGDYYYSASNFCPGIFSDEYGYGARSFGDSSSCIMITDSMVNTLRFFSENGFSDLLNFDTDVKSAAVISYSDAMDAEYTSWNFPQIHFAGSYYDSKSYNDSCNLFSKAMTITDTDKLASLAQSSYTSYYTDENVFYVRFALSDGGYSILCIPSSLAPQWLTSPIK